MSNVITSIKDNYLYIGKGALGEELGINSKYKIKVIEKPSYLSEEEITKNLLKPLGDFLLEIINEMDGVKLDPNIEYAKILNNALTWFSIGEKSLSMSIMYLDNKKQKPDYIGNLDEMSWNLSDKQEKKLEPLFKKFYIERKNKKKDKLIQIGNIIFEESTNIIFKEIGFENNDGSGNEYICKK